MKRIIVMVMTILLAIGFCSCGKNTDGNTVFETIGGEPVDFAQTQTYLVNKSKSDYKIVISASASKVEKYAAEELAYFMKLSTDCVLPIVTDDTVEYDNSGHYLSVGETSLYEKQTDAAVTFEELGYRGVSLSTRGNTVYIVGATEHGTLFSVYRFLYYQIGYKAYATDCIYYDHFTNLKLKNFDYKYKPGIGITLASDNAVIGESKTKDCLRMYTHAAGLGGYDLNGKMFNELWAHTVSYLVSAEAHPDLFSNGQLCFTNEESVEAATETLLAKYVNSASGPFIMIGGLDNIGSCGCDACKAEAEKYGGAGGAYVKFLNRVAENIENYFVSNGTKKELTIVGLMYYSYLQPPVTKVNGEYVAVDDAVKTRDGQVSVGVMFTPIDMCFNHPLCDDTCKTNVNYVEYAKGWSAVTNNFMFYSYGTNFGALRFHFNNWMSMGETYKFFAQLGAVYGVEEACDENGISPMSSMRIFVRASLGWNPYYDTQTLIDEFMNHYYGSGAEDVAMYFNSVMENFERVYTLTETECQGIYYNIAKNEYWTRPILLNYEGFLESAMYKLQNGDSVNKDIYTERIFREYFLVKDVEYEFYGKYYSGEALAEIEAFIADGREKYSITKSAE